MFGVERNVSFEFNRIIHVEIVASHSLWLIWPKCDIRSQDDVTIQSAWKVVESIESTIFAYA